MRAYVQNCHSCLQVKAKNIKSREGHGTIPVTGEPLTQWAADILELPATDDGFRYVLVITDYFTKWAETFALMNQTAETVAECLLRVVCRFGVMSSLLTDQGRNFESTLVRTLCEMMGIEKLRTSIYHPACNGLVERFNRKLIESLSHYCEEGSTDWVRWLPLTTFAYNTSQHSTTGVSPWELVFGGEPKTPVNVELNFQLEERVKNISHLDYLKRLKRKLQQLHEGALVRIRGDQSKRVEESRSRLKEGDQVYCRNFTAAKGKKGKLQPRFEGPYLVVQACPPDYIIQKGRRRRLVHGWHLKPVGTGRQTAPPAAGQNRPTPEGRDTYPSDVEEEDYWDWTPADQMADGLAGDGLVGDGPPGEAAGG